MPSHPIPATPPTSLMPTSKYIFIALFLGACVLQSATVAARSTSVADTDSLNRRALPNKVYGVNLGGWLVLEPWMLPQEWESMGGETCDNCADCIASEFALVKANQTSANASFQKHWESWFTQDDVDDLVSAGINTVRLPLGFWIVEALVDRASEYYPTGGITQLQRGLQMLSEAGINVILDHHGLPGVQTADQSFTGQCTSDVQFYTEKNYQRALVWAAVMTVVSHIDPAFATVSTIEAANEPLSNASQTPGYGTYMENFVQVVRLVEFALLDPLDLPTGTPTGSLLNISQILSGLSSSLLSDTVDPLSADEDGLLNILSRDQENAPRANVDNLSFAPSPASLKAISTAASLLPDIAQQLNLTLATPLGGLLGSSRRRASAVSSSPLNTGFMDILWQYSGTPSNPADAANGPAAYDDHLYYAYGGIADATEDAYLSSVCNLQRIQEDSTARNTPMYFGEWSLATQFDASDVFLSRWADAQKWAYSQGTGWIFWNFKIEQSTAAADLLPQWSYLDALDRGIFTQDPSDYNDPDVCKNYTTSSR